MFKKILLALSFLQCLPAPAALAEPEPARQSVAEIRQAVFDFLKSKLDANQADYEIGVTLPDSRLQLARCGQPLDIFVQSGGFDKGKLSVGVRCRAETAWLIYLQAQVKQFRNVVVLTRAIERGAPVTPDDLSLERQDVTRLRQGYLSSVDQALHLLANRSLSAGTVLNPAALEAPKLIRRGQTVAIIAQSGTLDVRMQGKALMDGTAGARISVRNDKSNRVVEGIVAGPGLVKVGF